MDDPGKMAAAIRLGDILLTTAVNRSMELQQRIAGVRAHVEKRIAECRKREEWSDNYADSHMGTRWELEEVLAMLDAKAGDQ